MEEMTRREFLERGGKGAAIVLAGQGISALTARRANGANERVQVALIGCGGRGSYVARGMIEEGADITYLCDVHPGRVASTAQFLSEAQDRAPQRTGNMAEVFDPVEWKAFLRQQIGGPHAD